MSVSSGADRHARMLRIFHYLQSGGGLNATDLAGQLGVCRRTIFRDLDLMRQAGIDLYYDAPLACYRLAPRDYMVEVPSLSSDEVATLVAAVHLSILHQSPDCQGVLRQTLGKLLTSLPSHLRHPLRRLTKSCRVQSLHENGVSAWSHVVHPLLMAIAQRKMLRLSLYEPSDCAVIETRFAPYQMIASAGRWSVVGRSSHHRGVRTFDACQLKRAEVTDQIYAIPRGYQQA